MELHYKILPHDGGWAYQADGTYSETFRTHDQACEAVRRVVKEQVVPGKDVRINFETPDGVWHEQFSHGDDRPTVVVD